MRRFAPQNYTLYILLALMVFFAVSTLQDMDRKDGPTYSQIRTLFLQERVERFTLEDSTLTLSLRDPEGGPSTRLTYRLADPAVFYTDRKSVV